jgi:hypothetical protein
VQYLKDELAEILKLHLMWLKSEDGGKRADLSGADLSGANLRSADLRSADLSGADLSGADLRSADLRSANLRSADLRSADLRSANLRSADLSGADLRSANLRSADLSGADAARTIICAEGDIIGWKKCQNGVIVKLKIPAKAKRSNATGRKCRAEYAKVIEIFNSENGEGISAYDSNIIYKVGKTIKPDKFDENRWDECSNGIHFFITRAEAEAY